MDAGLIDRVIGECREMPGLLLTMRQAERLWGCDEATGKRVIAMLIQKRVLRFRPDGRLVRAE